MKKYIAIIISVFLFNTLTAQKLTKEEKKQRKSDLKILIENMTDTEISYENLQKLDKIKFIKQSSEHNEDIKIIHEHNLHKFLPFQNVFNDGKKIYVFKKGIGTTYPNDKNLNNHIDCEQIFNIYNFVKPDESSCMIFEFKGDLKNEVFQYAAIDEAVYQKRMELLKTKVSLKKQITEKEFTISYNTVSGISSSYNEGECSNLEKTYDKVDFFIVSSDPNESTLKEESIKASEQHIRGGNFSYFEQKIKGEASNIYLDYYNINFEIDSIKLYKLNVFNLLNSGILKDSIKTYWLKEIQFESFRSYNDLNSLFISKNYEEKKLLDRYNSNESYMMSTYDYWNKIIPKDEELQKFITEYYINLPFSINTEEYIKNNNNKIEELNITKLKIDNRKFNWQNKDFSVDDIIKYNPKNVNYFYASSDIKVLRDDIINLLSSEFCKRSRNLNAGNKQKEKEEKYKNELAEKYGRKYAEAALEGDIIIGMPEDLLTIPLRAWNIDSSSEWENGYLIYCKFKFDTSKRIKVIVRNGKVSEISQW